jgi:ABC-type multidrug transport system fused ATPase/permease subunit
MAVRVINYKLGLKLAWTLFDGMLGASAAPHGLLRQGAPGAHPQPLRPGSGEAQEMLLSMLVGLFGMLVSVALQVVVIGINIPLLLLIAPLVGWALYVLQRRYRAVQLKLRRQSSVLRSPLHQHQRDHPRRPRPAPGRGRAFRAGSGAAPL